MSKRIALLDASGKCLSVALWDGVSAWDPVAGGLCASTQDTTADPQVGTGWTLAAGTWTAPAPAPPVPDPDGFATAVASDTTLANATRLAAAKYLGALKPAVAAGNTAIITALWQLVIAEAAMSAADQSAVHGYATRFGIPGI